MNILEEGLKELNLEYTKKQTKLINRYVSEIEMWNPKYGLVNAKGDTLMTKHILDSLTGVKAIKEMNGYSLADVGSGAGLPGIPLAIMIPELHVTLIERSGKRVRFLRNVQALLGLDNLEIQEEDLKNVTDKFDLVTFRAFKPLEPGIIRLLMNILGDSGKLVAYKGKMENITMEIEMVKDLATVEKIIPLSVPGLRDERNLVIYKA
ncbi:MAG: 16S rRNA (guanine(527)-N(7))-methyltransferase RsmG [Spirochaetaceae bacterium]|nr:16S rRNA (guanine(527)-N(7))-methyltransferase RsmG [Spirochaetaceae bacterium]